MFAIMLPEQIMPRRAAKEFGEYIVADPNICHGQLTFRGTRIFVEDVLDQVARGMDWNAITREWRGSVSRAAIAEAVRLASTALIPRSRRSARRRIAG